MTTEYELRRQQRLEREAREEAAAAERAAALVGVDNSEPEADPNDCPECGAHVNGQWAVITTHYASMSGPEESSAFCEKCVPWVYRKRLWEMLGDHRSAD